MATIEFGGYYPSGPNPIGYGNAPFLLAQFRDPANPNSTLPNNPANVFNLTVPTSEFEGGTVSGDSGGPLFIVLANGNLVQIGALSGGANPAYPPPPPGAQCNGGLAPNPCRIGLYGDGSAWTPLTCSWTGSHRTIRCGKSRQRREISIGATRRPGSMRFPTRRGPRRDPEQHPR